jgi:hypothetical protein
VSLTAFVGFHLPFTVGVANAATLDGGDGIRDDDAAHPITENSTSRLLHAESNPATSNCIDNGFTHQSLFDPTGGQLN